MIRGASRLRDGMLESCLPTMCVTHVGNMVSTEPVPAVDGPGTATDNVNVRIVRTISRCVINCIFSRTGGLPLNKVFPAESKKHGLFSLDQRLHFLDERYYFLVVTDLGSSV